MDDREERLRGELNRIEKEIRELEGDISYYNEKTDKERIHYLQQRKIGLLKELANLKKEIVLFRKLGKQETSLAKKETSMSRRTNSTIGRLFKIEKNAPLDVRRPTRVYPRPIFSRGTREDSYIPPQTPNVGGPAVGPGFRQTPSPYGWWTWIIVIIAILISVVFLITNPLGFASFLGPYWMVILAAIGIGIVIFFSARGKNVPIGTYIVNLIGKIWNFIVRHWMIIILIISGLLLFFYAAAPLLASGITGIFGALAANVYFKWIIAGIFIALGLYLIFKKVKDKDNPYPYRKLGLVITIISVLFVWLYDLIYNLLLVSYTDLLGFRWLITISLIVLGFYLLLFSKNYKTWGIFLVIMGIIFWVVVPFFSSTLFEKYGLKGEIAAEEAGLGKRLERFLFYVNNPEKYFAQFGEFTNPQAREKRALVGLHIEKFEPVITAFRSDQDIRLTAEVKHYALPKFEGGVEDYNTISADFFCNATTRNNETVQGMIEIKSSTREVRDNKIPFVNKYANLTFFVLCNFEKGDVKSRLDLKRGESETKKATLIGSYNNFVTESVLKIYILGKEKYDEINNRENRDLEFLKELRSSASYPGLINNERRTISEYSSGPVKLSVNVLNGQPLTSGDIYTLVLRSEPNSIDWEGNIKVKDIFLEVPEWFVVEDDKCAFTPGGGTPSFRGLKRLQLKENGKRQLYLCEGNISVGNGCNYFCDFRVEEKGEFNNIEEYNIRSVQVTDYILQKSTTFGLINSGFENEEKLDEEERKPSAKKDVIEKPIGETRIDRESLCGNDELEEGEVCDDGGICSDGNFCLVGLSSCSDSSECRPYDGNGCINCEKKTIG